MRISFCVVILLRFCELLAQDCNKVNLETGYKYYFHKSQEFGVYINFKAVGSIEGAGMGDVWMRGDLFRCSEIDYSRFMYKGKEYTKTDYPELFSFFKPVIKTVSWGFESELILNGQKRKCYEGLDRNGRISLLTSFWTPAEYAKWKSENANFKMGSTYFKIYGFNITDVTFDSINSVIQLIKTNKINPTIVNRDNGEIASMDSNLFKFQDVLIPKMGLTNHQENSLFSMNYFGWTDRGGFMLISNDSILYEKRKRVDSTIVELLDSTQKKVLFSHSYTGEFLPLVNGVFRDLEPCCKYGFRYRCYYAGKQVFLSNSLSYQTSCRSYGSIYVTVINSNSIKVGSRIENGYHNKKNLIQEVEYWHVNGGTHIKKEFEMYKSIPKVIDNLHPKTSYYIRSRYKIVNGPYCEYSKPIIFTTY
jgi:hypothetical protein